MGIAEVGCESQENNSQLVDMFANRLSNEQLYVWISINEFHLRQSVYPYVVECTVKTL